MTAPYLLAKWLHILSSTVLFGTGIGTAFQMVMALRSRNAGTVASVASAVVLADWVFTTPAGLIQPATGLWLINLTGHPWNAPWLLATYALYAAAFLCWAPVVWLQYRIRDLAAAQPPDAELPAAAIRLGRFWFALGWPAFTALVAVFWLMVSKPDPLF